MSQTATLHSQLLDKLIQLGLHLMATKEHKDNVQVNNMSPMAYDYIQVSNIFQPQVYVNSISQTVYDNTFINMS